MAKVLALVGGVQTEIEISLGGGPPLYVAPMSNYAVPANSQVLYAVPIDIDGYLDLDGALVEVQ